MRPPGRLAKLDARQTPCRAYLSPSERAQLDALAEDYGSRSAALRMSMRILAVVSPAERRLLEQRAGIDGEADGVRRPVKTYLGRQEAEQLRALGREYGSQSRALAVAVRVASVMSRQERGLLGA